MKTSPGRFCARFSASLTDIWIFLFAWIPTQIGMALRLFFWRPLFHRCGTVRFHENLTFSGLKNISLGNGVRLGKGSYITANGGELEIGDFTAISPCAHVGADNGRIIMGKYCAIGPGVVLRAANHRFDRLDAPISTQGHKPGSIIVEDDVWVGANSVITPDVILGTGCIIGAGSVVTHNVEPYSIVGGVPARLIARRKPPAGF